MRNDRANVFIPERKRHIVLSLGHRVCRPLCKAKLPIHPARSTCKPSADRLYTARILADFEQFTGGSIASHFDLIAGTSIGGILALALAVGVKAEKMVNLFEKHGEEIFKPRFNLRNVWRSTYTLTRLASLLQATDVFGEQTLGDCQRPVIVLAINYSTGEPVVFKTRHHENFFNDQKHRLVDVALATSATPMYFPRHAFNNCQGPQAMISIREDH